MSTPIAPYSTISPTVLPAACGEPVQGLLRALRAWWHGRHALRRQRELVDAVAGLDDNMLADIGLSDEVRSRVLQAHAVRDYQLALMSRGLVGGVSPRGRW